MNAVIVLDVTKRKVLFAPQNKNWKWKINIPIKRIELKVGKYTYYQNIAKGFPEFEIFCEYWNCPKEKTVCIPIIDNLIDMRQFVNAFIYGRYLIDTQNNFIEYVLSHIIDDMNKQEVYIL